MDSITLYKIWAPEDSVWSPWVKPVPFAFWPRMPKSDPMTLRAEISPVLFPATTSGTALIIDLPGGESVRCGLLLASLGYRPVPIFASCPLNSTQQGLYPCVVDADEIVSALADSADALVNLQFSSSAPPAFLIDALRQSPTRILSDNYFDNRSAVFASDFPSAETLSRHSISRVIILRDAKTPEAPDLGHALNHWRKSGIEIDAITHLGTPTEISWPASGFFGNLLFRLKSTLSLHSNEMGGYGRFHAASSGG